MDDNGAKASLGERAGHWCRQERARFLVLVVALALGLSASNSWSQDVFSSRGSPATNSLPRVQNLPTEGYGFGPGWEHTSVIRGSQWVLRWCRLLADYSGVICEDGMDDRGKKVQGGFVRPKGWSGIGNSPPVTAPPPPSAAPRTIGNRGLTPQEAQERQERWDKVNSSFEVQLFNAWAKEKDYPPYEAGPSISNMGKKGGWTSHNQSKIVNSTRTTGRGAIRLAPLSRSSARRTTTQAGAADPNSIFRLKDAR